MKEIYFAGGCFWGTEMVFRSVPGVTDTTVGYANGHTLSPTYREVCTDTTGHRETVKVVYEPVEIVDDIGRGERGSAGFGSTGVRA